ncbi:MBL fold metallo-hydrolase [Vibrio splendidus]|uniref:MBL fold metallo-hydrolase n=1 Tax=Vibrio splendidus TaxID=29497 RepID=UPI002118FC95|nr:MBL fold metallo-hydrolase [Vibrio splendidus]MCQ8868081.1 MBL fold metallo-hydrolase [Vibrio splendidus]
MDELKRSVIIIAAFGLTNIAYAQSPQMNTTIIGSGSPDYNPERVSAGVLITQGGTQILVDMGDGVKRNLEKHGVDGRKMNAILFTHHHLDHNADFSPIFTSALLGRGDFLVAGPKQTKDFVNNNINLYDQDLDYRLGKTQRSLDERLDHLTIRELKSGDRFNVDEIKVSTLSVPHTIESIAYRFDYSDQSVVITGDLSAGPGVAKFAKDANCLIIDSGGMIMNKRGKKQRNKTLKSEGKNGAQKGKKQHAHLNIKESSQIAADANINKLVYTHFVLGEIDKSASMKIIEQQYKGEIIFSDDLMSLNCGNKTTN